MSLFPDLSTLTPESRQLMADAVKGNTDFRLPKLTYFNDKPCSRHKTIQDGRDEFCQDCGIGLYKHQRVGVAWLYLTPKALVGDITGSGKSQHIAGLLAVIKQTGELRSDSRALIVTKAAAVDQLSSQLTRMIPSIPLIVARGPRAKRVDSYMGEWDVCVISYATLIYDHEAFENLKIKTLLLDDVDPLRNRETRAAYAIKRLAKDCTRVAEFHATSMQKRLTELWSIFEPLGGRQLFGTLPQFERRHLDTQLISTYDPSKGRVITKKEVVGYRNTEELKTKIAPFLLRRTESEIDDVEMPQVIPEVVYLDLYPAQRQKYQQLQRGVLEIIKNEGALVSRMKAQAAWMFGNMICGGLSVLGEDDGPGTSSKMDWVEYFVDATEEKTVVFLMFKNGVRSMNVRLDHSGVGYATITGETKTRDRKQEIDRFWQDPACKVMTATSVLESSLNLQCARHIVAVDMISNAARMTQLAGRVKRVGSIYKTVYVHSLLSKNTQQERLYDRIRREQALSDHIFDSKSELFESLSPLEMMGLIGG